ncbi:hypothetical protein [Paraburkholderia tuberum]|uniref:Uncharacterized protein n=1 Tax=Paraburkholderia tuberum TaxID=157910 RepID=A0A1H1JSI3_9BURK|nr:hypothetical protein [Paraburkholderia tuberum]SDR52956.1 hypothetical protein SAMN05445850_5580 [Paraburkholderia tuberum]
MSDFMTECGWSEDEYLAAIQQNLPNGLIWDLADGNRTISRFWRAIAAAFSMISMWLCVLLEEMFPCTADEMLMRWAVIYGYPLDCPSPALTAVRLCEWIRLQDSDCAGPTLGFLQEVAAWLGYEPAALSEWGAPQSSAGCGQLGCMQLGGSSDAPALLGYSQWLIVTVPKKEDTVSGEMGCGEMGCNDMSSGDCAPLATIARAQLGSCDFQLGCTPVCSTAPPPIMCLISKFIPAHVGVRYWEK